VQVSPKAEWLLRVPEIRAELAAIETPVVDRSMVEQLFRLKRRRSIELMHQLGGFQSGRTFLIDRLQLLQLPGIQDVVFDRHAGSFTVYVYGIAPVVSASLIGMVQERINDRAAFPITGVAVNPDLVGVSLASTLRLSQSPSAVEKEIILNTATVAAEEYINNLRVGGRKSCPFWKIPILSKGSVWGG
jgi:hypothetical protein